MPFTFTSYRKKLPHSHIAKSYLQLRHPCHLSQNAGRDNFLYCWSALIIGYRHHARVFPFLSYGPRPVHAHVHVDLCYGTVMNRAYCACTPSWARKPLHSSVSLVQVTESGTFNYGCVNLVFSSGLLARNQCRRWMRNEMFNCCGLIPNPTDYRNPSPQLYMY